MSKIEFNENTISAIQTEKHIHRVFVLIYSEKTRRFLTIHRADDGTWGLPGGKTEGQTALDAIKRETLEEIGFTLNNPEEIYTFPVGDEKYCTVFLENVPDEFCPELNTESINSAWSTLENWPTPAHPQMLRLIKEAGQIILQQSEQSSAASNSPHDIGYKPR